MLVIDNTEIESTAIDYLIWITMVVPFAYFNVC